MKMALGAIGGLTMVYTIILGFELMARLTLYILKGVGLYKMTANIGFSAPWLSFIPFANTYCLGRVAQTYVKRDRTPSARFGGILLTLNIVRDVFVTAIVVLSTLFLIRFSHQAMGAVVDEMELISSFAAEAASLAGIFMLYLGVALTFRIIYLVALWRCFALYDSGNATVYLVLSIFFGFLAPIFLFILRNRTPKPTYEERNYIYVGEEAPLEV